MVNTAGEFMKFIANKANIGKSRLLSLSSSLVFLFFIIFPLSVSAQNLPDQPRGHVNDLADMLTQTEQQRLETKLRNYRDTTTTVIAIATLNSLQGYSIEETATRLFNEWKIWEGDKDNGLLILIAKQERKMRIEVGYGLEGAIPDVLAGRIVREILTPEFKRGEFYAGLDNATSAIIQLASGEYTGQLTKESAAKDDVSSFIVFILFIIFVVYASSRGGGRNSGRRRKQRTLGSGGYIWLGSGGFSSRSGGGSSGGFGGFSGGGGFGSGGGGASGGW